MNRNRLITYSLLAHINNSGTLVKGLVDIFIPIVKSAISKMNTNGIFSGKNISEIKENIVDLYSIDIPVPVLRNILDKIAEEINTDNHKRFVIYRDGAFSIQDYLFDEFEALIEEKHSSIDNVEKFFQEFCKLNNITKSEYSSIFKFLDKNKASISKYLNNNHKTTVKEDFSIEAQFVSFFKRIPKFYNTIKDLYLGSILSSYVEFSTNPLSTKVELVLDTNFIVSIIDLNTPESTETCNKLLEIARHNGYKITVLIDTIKETRQLILKKAEHFYESFLTKKINPEDIYNACERRSISKTDLEHIADNLEKDLSNKHGVIVIPNTTKYSNIARFSNEYLNLQKFRYNKSAALHDATAIYYVREKRNNKRIKSFENVNCWFVNNAFNTEYNDFAQCEKVFISGFQPEIIKVDVLLNILWLSNPNMDGKLNGEDIIRVGLPALISSTLNESLPKNAIIRELDDNIHKYAEASLTDEQIVRVATRIANKQIINIESLNKLARKNKEEFVKRLQEEAEKQKEIEIKRIEQIEKILTEIQKESESIKKERLNFDDQNKEVVKLRDELEKAKSKEIEKENKIRELKREKYINEKVYKWRKRSWIELSISLLVTLFGIMILLFVSDWNMSQATKLFIALKGNLIFSFLLALIGIVFSSVIIKSLFNKYRNHSNIKAFKELIEMPEEIKEIKPSR